MDLPSFRHLVDCAQPGINACERDLHRMYDYVGLARGSSYSTTAVTEELRRQVYECFTSGHLAVRRVCKLLRRGLIYEHILLGTSLDPYFEVIDILQDACRATGAAGSPIEGDWGRAVQSAFDHTQVQSLGVAQRRAIHTRDFAVAEAARALRHVGFSVSLEAGRLRLEDRVESALVAAIETAIADMGGINVARRIFKALEKDYDIIQERYHVTRRISSLGGGSPQVPWGYLIQLAAKHIKGQKPYKDTDAQWGYICELAQAYAAVLDVQSYSLNIYGTMNAIDLLPYLQEMALYDTLFCIPQMRSSDVVKVAKGMLGWLDMDKLRGVGWTIRQAIEVIGYLTSSASDVRGPVFIDEANVRRACRSVPHKALQGILDSLLSHPAPGPNRWFSRPNDAPVSNDSRQRGHDFFLRPLIYLGGRRFVILDRSVCAPAYLESLFTDLRNDVEEFDTKLGLVIEKFLKEEFLAHGISCSTGNYKVSGEAGQCDLVVESSDTVIFLEIKKKALTRQARAGIDVYLMMDLAESLVRAQSQAGAHEVRLRRHGQLQLEYEGVSKQLILGKRNVERVAVSLSDFGSFQDRIILKQFLEAAINGKFSASDVRVRSKFDALNEYLVRIRDQVTELYAGDSESRQPFFNCWFLSLPQLLVFLDGVTDSDSFKKAIWGNRFITTSTSDAYYEMAFVRDLNAENARLQGDSPA